MDIPGIVEQLKQELARIERAIAVLEGPKSNAARRGRSPISSGSRQMSAAARARIGAAKKAWWAEQKGKATGKRPS